ncbi:MAG: FAD binding domain-containing protein [Planctomycetota bacterium]|jgi:carbon-monoxide dehydrogenase medium subunit
MKDFAYHRAGSIKEAVALLKKGKGRLHPLAGGTDLLVQWKTGKTTPEGVVDLKGISDLRGIRQKKGGLVIGPCTTLAEIAASSLLKKRLPILPAVALMMGSPQVRNRGTLGGNLANAAPSADMAPPLIALDAKVRIVGPQGRKTHPLAAFFLGPGKTLMKPGALLTEVAVPVPKRGTKVAFHPLTLREAMDISIASVAVAVRREKKKIAHARVVLGAVAPVPLVAEAASKVLRGTAGTPEDVADAARAAAREAKPISDQRGSRTYRRDMIEVLVERALTEVLA